MLLVGVVFFMFIVNLILIENFGKFEVSVFRYFFYIYIFLLIIGNV